MLLALVATVLAILAAQVLPVVHWRQRALALLREHGIVGAASSDVKASTLAAFALGDYEWILALEGDDLARVVDVMKDLRYVEARRYVDVDTPFFTGERVSPVVWADRQMRA